MKTFLFPTLLLSVVILISCNPTPKWDSYTYNGENIVIRNDSVLYGNPPDDWSKMEKIITTNYEVCELKAHKKHQKQKYESFKDKFIKISNNKTFLSHNGTTFIVLKNEKKKGLNIEWGIQMITPDKATIYYFKRKESFFSTVIYKEVDGVMIDEFISSYNNLYYDELLKNLPN